MRRVPGPPGAATEEVAVRSDEMVKKVHQVARHRNGIGGEPFYAVLFDGPSGDRLLGIVHDEPSYCSVIQAAPLSDSEVGVEFGGNSWRGDKFEPELRAAIAKWEKAR